LQLLKHCLGDELGILSTNNSGHNSTIETLNAANETAITSQLEAPTVNQSSAPNTDQSNAPTVDQSSAPNTDQSNAPTVDKLTDLYPDIRKCYDNITKAPDLVEGAAYLLNSTTFLCKLKVLNIKQLGGIVFS